MGLTANQARALVDAAFKAAESKGYLICAMVVDENGHFVYGGKMDGTKFVAPDIARAKAYASVAFRNSTGAIEKAAESKPVFYSGVQEIFGGRLVVGQGAVPIWEDNRLVGALGISGAASHEDEEVAVAAVAATGYTSPDPVVATALARGHAQ